jgi:hypothetical protein
MSNGRKLLGFRNVVRNSHDGLISKRVYESALKEESDDGGISDAMAFTIGDDISSSDRVKVVDRFCKKLRAMNSSGANIILTAISFE